MARMRKRALKTIQNINYNSLYKQTLKDLREAERRIKQLEKGVDVNRGTYNPKTKRFERKGTYTVIENGVKRKIKPVKRESFKKGTWASKKLEERLEILNVSPKSIKSGKVPTSKLKAVDKALQNFLKSQTSTIKGIKKVEDTTKNSLSKLLGDIDGIDNEDIETLHSFFKDKDLNYITQYIDPSELFITLSETKAEGGTSDDLLRKIENYIYSDSLYKDDDLVESLENIYNKYIGS